MISSNQPCMFTWLPLPHLPRVPDHFVKHIFERAQATKQLHDLLGDNVWFDQLNDLFQLDTTADARQFVLDHIKKLKHKKDSQIVADATQSIQDPAHESLDDSDVVNLSDFPPDNWRDYKDRTVLKNGIEHKSRTQERFFLGEEWEDWVRQNIIPTFSDTGGRVNVGESGNTLHGAHTDGPIYRLYYLLSSGGDHVETVYYMDPKMPILHATKIAQLTGHYNMDELIEIDRVRFPVGQWILHNGYVLHGVENICSTRINVTVNIRPEWFDFCIKY